MEHLVVGSTITSWSLHILQELLSGPLAFASIGFLSEEKATLLSSAKDPLH